MDTNIVGRMAIRGEPEFEKPRVKWLAVFDLTEGAHGNAAGLGLANFTIQSLVDKIDMDAFNANVITSGFLERGAIPLTMNTEKEVVDVALRLLGGTAPEEARVVRIWDTLHLGHLQVSESVLAEVQQKDGVEMVMSPEEMAFMPDGSLKPIDWAAWLH